MSHDVKIASQLLNGGYLGPPFWISGFFQTFKQPSSIRSEVIKRNKTIKKGSNNLQKYYKEATFF